MKKSQTKKLTSRMITDVTIYNAKCPKCKESCTTLEGTEGYDGSIDIPINEGCYCYDCDILYMRPQDKKIKVILSKI